MYFTLVEQFRQQLQKATTIATNTTTSTNIIANTTITGRLIERAHESMQIIPTIIYFELN